MTTILQRQARAELPEAVRKVQKIKRDAAALFWQVESTWNASVRAVWTGNTAEILAEMGTDATEFFRVSAETAKFLESMKPGSTAYGRALMRAFNEHADGRITLSA